MTDQTAPTTDGTTDAEQPNTEEPQEDSPTTEDPNGSKAGRDAAKYRVRLRETEAERDTLAERLSTYQRAEAEKLASEHLELGSDLFDVGNVKLADLLNDDGEVDENLVATAAFGITEQRPRLKKPTGRRGPGVIGSGNGHQSAGGSSTSWGSILQNR